MPLNNPLFQEEFEVDILDSSRYMLIVWNDDVNTFDHVINSLMATCKHKLMEAEQCAYIVHTAGKCIVKYGMYDELEPQCTSLLEKGLSAKIE